MGLGKILMAEAEKRSDDHLEKIVGTYRKRLNEVVEAYHEIEEYKEEMDHLAEQVEE